MSLRHFGWGFLVIGCCACAVACGGDDEPGGGGTGGTGGTTDASADAGDGSTQPDAAADSSADTSTEDAAADAAEAGDDAQPDAQPDAEPDAEPDASPDRPCTLGGDECEPGEKCAPVGAGEALVCRPDGDKILGEECGENGVDDCVSGTACVPYDATTHTCETLCNDSVPCANNYEACFDWFGPTGDVAGVCLGDGCTPPATDCEDGERCTVMAVDEQEVAACVPAGPVDVGGDCSVDECQAGAMCVQTGSEYVCRAYCDAGADCVDDDLHCAWPWTSLPNIGLCRSGCDPVRQTGCGTDEGCYFEDPAEGSTMCWAAGDLTEGEDCSSGTELCTSGVDCVLDPGSSSPYTYHCRAFCDAENACTNGTCQTTDATEALKFCMP